MHQLLSVERYVARFVPTLYNSRSACPLGSVVSQDATSNILNTCNVPGSSGVASGGCANGYTCYNSQLLGQNVCCGAGGRDGMLLTCRLYNSNVCRSVSVTIATIRVSVDTATNTMSGQSSRNMSGRLLLLVFGESEREQCVLLLSRRHAERRCWP
jgi:hypothetical protein